MALLVDDILGALAQTAHQDADNGSEYAHDRAKELGLTDDDVRPCTVEAAKIVRDLVARRRSMRKNAADGGAIRAMTRRR